MIYPQPITSKLLIALITFVFVRPITCLLIHRGLRFFHRSGEFEKAIAYGVVKALTEQGAAQIQVYPVDPEEQDILDIINNEKANILVRPTLTSDAISNIAKYV